jgi:voltage-gated potassium channel
MEPVSPPIARSAPPTRLAAGQFVAALVWLACLAVVLHLHERAEDKAIFYSALAGLGVMYPVFWAEWLWRASRGDGWSRTSTWCSVLPILRIGLRDPAAQARVWLPRLGWRDPNEELIADVDRALSVPMLLISLAVLPVVIVEYVYAEKLEAEPRLAQLTAAATAVIWWSFTVEFVLMVSLTSKKLAYCKQHWLDLAIILLPLLAFLRALRLGRLLRLQSLGKTARMYKLRGVAMRTYRALLLIDAISRLIQGHPRKRLERLRRQIVDQEAALERTRSEILGLEAQLATEPSAPAADHAAA